MTKTLEDRIELFEICTNSENEMLGSKIIKELQAENQALQNKFDEALGRVEIAKEGLETATQLNEHSETFLADVKYVQRKALRVLEQLNKQGVENDE